MADKGPENATTSSMMHVVSQIQGYRATNKFDRL